jgi:uncharacterized membrane protein
MYRYGFFGGHGGGPHAWGIVLFVLFLIAVVALVVALVHWLRSGSSRGAPSTAAGPPAEAGDAALAAARMRYARGEIGQDEFLRISGDLRAHLPGAGAA